MSDNGRLDAIRAKLVRYEIGYCLPTPYGGGTFDYEWSAQADIDYLLTEVARLTAENAVLKGAYDETDTINHDLSCWNEVLQKEIDALKQRVDALEKPEHDDFLGWAISSSLPGPTNK